MAAGLRAILIDLGGRDWTTIKIQWRCQLSTLVADGSNEAFQLTDLRSSVK